MKNMVRATKAFQLLKEWANGLAFFLFLIKKNNGFIVDLHKGAISKQEKKVFRYL